MIHDFRIGGVNNFILQESFDEQWTGVTDPNGNKIYRRSYIIPSMPSSGGNQTVDLGVTIGDNMMLVGGHLINQNTGNMHPLPYTNVDSTTAQVGLEMAAPYTHMTLTYGTVFWGGTGAFLLEYTKA